MKKIVNFLIISLVFVSVSFAQTTVLYRISSGEVKGISQTGEEWPNAESPYYNQVTDPTFVDGYIWQGPDPTNRNRVLGYAKIYVDGIVRNATQEEIDAFVVAREEDRNIERANKAKEYLQDNQKLRMIIKAFADIVRIRTNAIAKWNMDFKAAVAASTSLADLQSRVAALGNLPDYDFTEMIEAIENRISKDD